MIGYLDSSAVVKLLLEDEPESDDLGAVLRDIGALATTRLTYVEVRGALSRARRDGRLSGSSHVVAVEALDELVMGMLVVDLRSDVARRAGDVAESLGLRAGDAIQLATAMSLRPASVAVFAWDARLRTAAAAAGFPLYPPLA